MAPREPRSARPAGADAARIRVGCAGWSIPRAHAALFPAGPGSVLERYAAVFDCVEVNSSFYRPHRPATWRRWAASTPARFRFCVKMPRAISHEARLADCDATLERFLAEVAELGDKLDCLLLQLPPSLPWQPEVARPFLDRLRRRHPGPVACEPRHPSWFRAEVGRVLRELDIARVAADPARVPRAAVPGGSHELAYLRLHGAPRMYYDGYGREALERIARRVAGSPARRGWCIFDNTALGHATADAATLAALLGKAATGSEHAPQDPVAAHEVMP